jgi:hypothetical protein
MQVKYRRIICLMHTELHKFLFALILRHVYWKIQQFWISSDPLLPREH